MKNYWQVLVKNSFKIKLQHTDHFVFVEGRYLLRHFFGDKCFFWCCARESFGGYGIDDVANVATQISSSKQDVVS